MKCIRCETNNTLKDRENSMGRCRKCGHEFVFEPESKWSHPGMTDLFFANAIAIIFAYFKIQQFKRKIDYLLDREQFDLWNDSSSGMYTLESFG